ncbi:hypothetical protein OEW28_00440 [Defluviimonas sp. WL0002]|uniref:Chemotaxis protein n=1 Tax=Albidovulum marisflavi TaxID=2984159 RepID=A0ABT2Z8L7_9RHOB|nr:hypothetical protein [Defluviimonas sp. WL0002]MCV2867091.1 hypothetical protein [Defluviimonas sp. WL0002]
MDFLSDLLLFAAALGAGFYCLILSRRLNRFSRLETGMGGAIAVLSAQVDDLTRLLEGAREAAQDSADRLEDRTRRAEAAARQLELMLASLHDLPAKTANASNERPRLVRRRAAAKPQADR